MFTVVTDSSSYFDRRSVDPQLLRVVPLSYSIGDQAYFEGYSDENGRFVELLKLPTHRAAHTAQVPVGGFLSTFHELQRQHREVLCLTISSRLSGTYGSALIAAGQVDASAIAVVDSLSTAGGLRFLVEYACALSAQGVPLPEAVEQLEKKRESVGIVFSVESMEALRASGRISSVRQSVGTVLNIRPILLCSNGIIVSGGIARGRSEQVAKLLEAVPPEAERLSLHYVQNSPKVHALAQAAAARFGGLDIVRWPIGPVLAVHLGIEAFGLAWQTGK
ncbi:MAG: DegV family protein [Clostridiales bacterium]|nr:DegV family protein [Clostridiales bacterium]